MLTKTRINQIIKENIFSYYKKNDFKYFHEYITNYFRRNMDGIIETNSLAVYQTSRVGFGHFITITDIENIIFEIGLPNVDLNKYDRKKDILYTLSSDFGGFNIGERNISTNQDCIDYCQSIINYMEFEGKAFVEKYSYLPNILKEMDRLVDEGKYWNGMYGKGGILTGLGDAYFRGLIISKLCNDVGFENKLIWVQNIFDEDKQWIPYYEKLKERLQSVEPIYNV